MLCVMNAYAVGNRSDVAVSSRQHERENMFILEHLKRGSRIY